MKSVFVAFLTCSALFAQQPPSPGIDPIAQLLFPPELIMQHQQELGLDEKQRDQIRREFQGAQGKFFDFQWQMSEASEKLISLLKSSPIDEIKTLAQAEKVMNLEREIKKTHLGLLIRIKNQLTPEQLTRLEKLRSKARE
jgi:Spy/CpxP family protein refolding chaperone